MFACMVKLFKNDKEMLFKTGVHSNLQAPKNSFLKFHSNAEMLLVKDISPTPSGVGCYVETMFSVE